MNKKRLGQLLLSGVFTLCAAAIVGILDLAEKEKAKREAAKKEAAKKEETDG